MDIDYRYAHASLARDLVQYVQVALQSALYIEYAMLYAALKEDRQLRMMKINSLIMKHGMRQ